MREASNKAPRIFYGIFTAPGGFYPSNPRRPHRLYPKCGIFAENRPLMRPLLTLLPAALCPTGATGQPRPIRIDVPGHGRTGGPEFILHTLKIAEAFRAGPDRPAAER